jgi:hypothetical protein
LVQNLGSQKRKSFTFDEADVDWINPLILEWVKENEGKKQSDLIKELLQDYKTNKENIPPEEGTPLEKAPPSDGGREDYAGRISKSISASFSKLGPQLNQLMDALRDGWGKFMVKVRELEAGTRIRKSITNFSNELKPRLHQLLTDLRKKYKDLTESIGKLKVVERSSEAL